MTFPSRLREHIISARHAPEVPFPTGVVLRTFVSENCGATGFSTGVAVFQPLAQLEYHTHPFSEAITILQGKGVIFVEGRRYDLAMLDSVHIPRGVAHCVQNPDKGGEMIAHWAFASPSPTRNIVPGNFPIEDRGEGNPNVDDPESIRRFAKCEIYALSEGAMFVDLFAGRFGTVGICGGYGSFAPGASLPCHIHDYDESITIVNGQALCAVQDQRYKLSDLDTAFVPTGRPHRFFNDSDTPMSMLWVYAGDEPDRKILDPGYCNGSLVWPQASGG